MWQRNNPINVDELRKIEFLGVWKDNENSRVFREKEKAATNIGNIIHDFLNLLRDDGALSGIFSIQNGDEFWSSADVEINYQRYGKTSSSGPRSNHNSGITVLIVKV